jgi:hypothetical protein
MVTMGPMARDDRPLSASISNGACGMCAPVGYSLGCQRPVLGPVAETAPRGTRHRFGVTADVIRLMALWDDGNTGEVRVAGTGSPAIKPG